MKTNRQRTYTLVGALVLLSWLEPYADDTTGFFAGKIEVIDLVQKTLTVKGESSSMAFIIASDVKVYGADKKEMKLADLKVGNAVTVDYTRENGPAVAHTITLKEPTLPPLPPGGEPVPF